MSTTSTFWYYLWQLHILKMFQSIRIFETGTYSYILQSSLLLCFFKNCNQNATENLHT